MYQSPRMRRLRNDMAALERLRSESSVFRFSFHGDPPHHYLISFQGRGLWRDRGKVRPAEIHRVEIKLGASYPRTIPEIRWITPIYHPNISEIGMVCLGGYGTHWVPSVQLDELCGMLWDMARYHNYDIRSPYNRDAALWVANQTAFIFPIDARPLRDLRAAMGRVTPSSQPGLASKGSTLPLREGTNGSTKSTARRRYPASASTDRIRRFIERYGRVFGGEKDVGLEQQERAPSPSVPAPPTPPEGAAERVQAQDGGPPPAKTDPLAPAAAEVALPVAEHEEHDDELVILGSSAPDGLATGPPPADSDGIIFIE